MTQRKVFELMENFMQINLARNRQLKTRNFTLGKETTLKSLRVTNLHLCCYFLDS